MSGMFRDTFAFNQDLSDWNISSNVNFTSMGGMFLNAHGLSDVNKGLIHGTFSRNPNWEYDWSMYVTRPAHVVPSAANLRMLWVEPGTFTMGSPVTEEGHETDETEHNVTLTQGFYLGKYEVTQAQYEAVMTGNTNGLSPTPSQWPNNPNRPVEKVSWSDTQVFLSRLNTLEAANLPAGWTYVLPTEAQWEYACRAGTTTAYSWGDDGNASPGNSNQSGFSQTRDVGQYAPNAWGFFDMHGNIWEWVMDWKGNYLNGPQTDPTGPNSGSQRVSRGGSWQAGTAFLRSASRGEANANTLYTNTGFRLAFRQTSPPPPITDANFTTAINLWFTNEANATRIYGHISDWDVSAVTNMGNAFKGRTTFNEDISRWDVSSVTNMSWMFTSALSFNQPLGDWDVSKVINMDHMFSAASNFNQDISQWDTSKVTNMRYLFNDAENFDQDIGDWNTSKANNMYNMFSEAKRFNQDIGNWDTSSVISMGSMFKDAIAFNQNISDWNTSSVAGMNNIFLNTPSISNENKGLIHESFASNANWPYNWRQYVVIDDSNFQTAVNLWFDNQAEANSTYGHISDWNVSAVTDMKNAFFFEKSFNEDISSWDTSSYVTDMYRIFNGANAFNQPIGNWDVSSVQRMEGAFRWAFAFNKSIKDWNVSSVTNMSNMFNGEAQAFNQDIGNWDVSSVSKMKGYASRSLSLRSELKQLDNP